MPLCKNPHCMTKLGDSQWGEGYCSKRCFETGPDYDPEAHDNLRHPDEVNGLHRELCNNADLTDAMLEADRIDPRLPRILYLRRRGVPLRNIGRKCGMCESMVRKLLAQCAPKVLKACGLHQNRQNPPISVGM